MPDVSILGGSGYAGGELVRLLLDHPEVTVKQVTSERSAGKFIRSTHPNLRKRTDLKFSRLDQVAPCDVLFVALPHGVAMGKMADLRQKAEVVVDLSADFRLRNAADYPKWYGHDHSEPDLLGKFVYGIPELHRDELTRSNLI
ncbi:MAG: N-acetyl-gamma-glutamyl-phosphate reductase, partial [Chloroflexota bacterium]|nr:N-acetyl-gamma-glutamyl-phosphate reductase [Chloroflexota bacterium]